MWWVFILAAPHSLITMAKYKATQPENLPKHPVRSAILDAVQARPGISVTELRRELDCSWGTIYHHMHLLAGQRMIRMQRWKRARRLFPAVPEEHERPLTLLREGRFREIVEEVQARPGIIQRDITDSLGMSRKMLRYYVDILKDEGLLREVVEPATRTYFPTEGVHPLLDRLQREKARGQPVEEAPPGGADEGLAGAAAAEGRRGRPPDP